MKKTHLLFLAVLFSVAGFAQGKRTATTSTGKPVLFSLDATFNLPTSAGLTNATGIGLGAEVNGKYEFQPNLSIVGSVGFGYFFPKSGYKALIVAPTILAGIQYDAGSNFFLGGQIGYGRASSDGESVGGFAFKPYVGYAVSDALDVKAKFTTFSGNGSNISFFGLGVAIKF